MTYANTKMHTDVVKRLCGISTKLYVTLDPVEEVPKLSFSKISETTFQRKACM